MKNNRSTFAAIFLSAVFLSGGFSGARGDALSDAQKTNTSFTPFRVVSLPGCVPESALPEQRSMAIRELIRTGKTSSAIEFLKHEKNAVVLRDALVEFGVSGSRDAGVFVREQCASGDHETAKIAYSVLPKVEVFDAEIYESGMKHPAASVRVAATEAACEAIPVTPTLLPVVSGKIASSDSALSRAAIYASLRFNDAGVSDVSETGMNARAMQMAERFPTRVPEIVAALLRRRIQPNRTFAEKCLNSDAGELVKIVSEFGEFPDQVDSDLLRSIVRESPDDAACAALTLLCAKNSPKNDATLDTISNALASGKVKQISVVAETFQADSEFLRFRADGESDPAQAANPNNDYFGGPGSINRSVGSGNLSETVGADGTALSVNAILSADAMLRFLWQLGKAAENQNLAEKIRNQTQFLLLTHSRSNRLLDIVHQLFSNENAAIRRAAAGICLVRYDDLRYVKSILDAISGSKNAGIGSVLPFSEALSPYFVFRGDNKERLFLLCAKNLISDSDEERQILGLSLLSQYGKPHHAEYALPLCVAKSPLVRSAAAHCIARIAPEVYFFKIDEFAGDADASVRATVPAACLESGYERLGRINYTDTLTLWIEPRRLASGYTPKEKIINTLEKLSADSSREIRITARLALLEQGALPVADGLLRDILPEEASGISSQIAQSVNIAEAAGRKVPKELSNVGRPVRPNSKKSNDGEKKIVIFLRRDARKSAVTDQAISAFDVIMNDSSLFIYYLTDDVAFEKLRMLKRIFPISREDESKSVIAISSGGRIAKDTLNFADLCELRSHADNSDAGLPDAVLFAPAVSGQITERHLDYKFIIAGIVILAIAGGGVAAVIRRRRSKKILL